MWLGRCQPRLCRNPMVGLGLSYGSRHLRVQPEVATNTHARRHCPVRNVDSCDFTGILAGESDSVIGRVYKGRRTSKLRPSAFDRRGACGTRWSPLIGRGVHPASRRRLGDHCQEAGDEGQRVLICVLVQGRRRLLGLLLVAPPASANSLQDLGCCWIQGRGGGRHLQVAEAAVVHLNVVGLGGVGVVEKVAAGLDGRGTDAAMPPPAARRTGASPGPEAGWWSRRPWYRGSVRAPRRAGH